MSILEQKEIITPNQREEENMDIKNAQEVAFNQLDGKKIMRDIFENESEKERASKIADQLKGMTIREAQELLSKISEALVNSITF